MDSRKSDARKSPGQYNSFNSTVVCPGLRNYEEGSREDAIDDGTVSVRTDRTKILKRRLLEKQKSQQYIDPDLESWRSERKPLLNLTSETAKAFGARQAVFYESKSSSSHQKHRTPLSLRFVRKQTIGCHSKSICKPLPLYVLFTQSASN